MDPDNDHELHNDEETGKQLLEYMAAGCSFRCGELTVRVSFADTDRTLEDCMREYMRSDVR